MQSPVVIMGMGEMGGVFARGFLRAGYPVVPVLRGIGVEAIVEEVPDPAMVLLAVAEKDLHPALDRIPSVWRPRLALLQNELLPGDWRQHDIADPTVISVWFEKKAGQDFKVLIPSPVYGSGADLLFTSLGAIGIPARVLQDSKELLKELVVKNVYIVTTNVAGLRVGGGVGVLWDKHRQLATDIANEVMDIQFALIGQELPRGPLIDAMVVAFKGDLDHKCMGRSAPARLARAIAQADEADLAVPVMREIQHEQAG